MTSVHGISVAGGTFPAQIWRLFMDSAIGQLEPVDFASRRTIPSGRSSSEASTRGRSATTRTTTTRHAGRRRPARRRDGHRRTPCPMRRPPRSRRPTKTPATPTPPARRRRRRRRPRRRRSVRCRRPPSPNSPDPRRPARGGRGCSARCGLRRLRLGRSRAARAGGRRVARTAARSACSSSHSSCSRSPHTWAALLLCRRATGAPRRRRGRLRDPVDPARRSVAGLDRRVDVLGVRPDRRRARRRSLRRHAERVPGRPRLQQGRCGLARNDVGLRARVHAALGGRRARLRLVGGGRGLDLQGAGGARDAGLHAACGAAGPRKGLRGGARRLEPALRDPLRRRWAQRLRPDRAHPRRAGACRRRAQAARRRGLGAGGVDQVGPARLLRAPGGRRPRRPSSCRPRRVRVMAAAIIGLATLALRLDWLRVGRPARP